MKKYKVVGSSKPEFMNIEMNIVFEDMSLGKSCEVFGHKFVITQAGEIVALSSPTWVITLQEIPQAVEEKWEGVINVPSDLRINHEVDVFVGKKLLKIMRTDRLTDKNGVTFFCLYRFLKKEWQFIKHSTGVDFPFEYDPQHKLFIMRNEWNFDSLESISLMREGSFSRYSVDGRCI